MGRRGYGGVAQSKWIISLNVHGGEAASLLATEASTLVRGVSVAYGPWKVTTPSERSSNSALNEPIRL